MSELDPTQMGIEFGGGGLIGALIGFAAKKVAKIIAIIIGIELALFKWLESRGILTVDWERLSAGLIEAGSAAGGSEPPSLVMSLLQTLPVGAGFTGGFLLGFKKA